MFKVNNKDTRTTPIAMKQNLCKHINKTNVSTFPTVTNYLNVFVTFKVLGIFYIYIAHAEVSV